MLPPFIIEKLREREAAKQERGKQRRLELEIPTKRGGHPVDGESDDPRGVIEIPIWN